MVLLETNPGTKVRLDHLSGRWDRDPELLCSELDRSALLADIITLTEVDLPRRGRALQAWAKKNGWTLCRFHDGPRAEVAVLVRDGVWNMLRWTTYVIGPDLGPGRDVVVLLALLVHAKTDARLIVSTSHLPASVEGRWLHRTRRVLIHQTSVQRWRRLNRRWRRDCKPHAEIAIGDWNLNVHRPWVRSWIRTAWPGLRLPAVIPEQGSHGGRLIDWLIVRGLRVTGWTVLLLHPASDHRGIRVTGRIRSR